MTQAELDELEVGDVVFHKAFGYGEIIELTEKSIKVSFDDDNKKKAPWRGFVFPDAFFQGFLQL